MWRRALDRLRGWAGTLRRDVLTLWYCCRDARTPVAAKLMAMLTVGYALSPIDLIPDFIPVIGYLDDLILLPVAIYLTLKLIPAAVLDDCRARAARRLSSRGSKPVGYVAAGVIVLVWLALAWALWRLAADLLELH